MSHKGSRPGTVTRCVPKAAPQTLLGTVSALRLYCHVGVYPKATVVNARSDVTFRCGSPFRTLMAVACVALVLRSLLSGTIEMRTELEEVVL